MNPLHSASEGDNAPPPPTDGGGGEGGSNLERERDTKLMDRLTASSPHTNTAALHTTLYCIAVRSIVRHETVLHARRKAKIIRNIDSTLRGKGSVVRGRTRQTVNRLTDYWTSIVS